MGRDVQMPSEPSSSVEPCNAWEHLQFLSNSFQRVRLLDVLADSTTDLPSLRENLDAPRTTLQRDLSQLERRGWIERTSSGYSTTTAGRLLVSEVGRTIETVETIENLSPFLEAVADSRTLDVTRLNDPVVTVPEPNQPHAPMNRLFETLRTTTGKRGFVPMISAGLLQNFQIPCESSRDVSVFVLSSETVASIREGNVQDGDDLVDGNRLRLLEYDGKLPYGLVIAGESVALVAYDDVGRIRALVDSNEQEALEWAEQVYGGYRSQANLVRATDD